MKGEAEMKNYGDTKVVKDGSIYEVQRRFDEIWMCCGRYSDKEKAVLAAKSLVYCYGGKVVSITKK